MEPFIGQIIMFGGNFAPRSWALCQGQLLAIASNQALFSILGTTYGGDGRTTFALPDLRGRVPIQQGTGPGLSPYQLGQRGGVEQVTLSLSEMPQHNHAVTTTAKMLAEGRPANATNPAGNMLAATAAGGNSMFRPNARADDVEMDPAMLQVTTTEQNAGGSLPHTNLQPFLGVNYIIALQGLYPSRS